MGLVSSHHSRVIFWRPAARTDRNGGRARLARPADKDSLHRIACRLVRCAGTPANRRLVEAPTLPPVGIAASCVHGAFHRPRKRLPALICGNKKPLATAHPLHERRPAWDMDDSAQTCSRPHAAPSSPQAEIWRPRPSPAVRCQCRGSGSLPIPSASGDASSAGAVRESIMR